MNDTDDLYHIGGIDHHLDALLNQHPENHTAIAVQSAIINDMGNHHSPISMTELEYVNHANWSHGAGADSIDHIGNLLSAYGVSTHRIENAHVDQIMGELSAGHRVVVGFSDNHQAPHDGPLADFFHHYHEMRGLDPHDASVSGQTVAIKGLDTSDPHHPQVLLYDPSHPDAPAVRYPVEDFEKAWHTSDFTLVATDSAPVSAANYPEHHDPAQDSASHAPEHHGTMPDAGLHHPELAPETASHFFERHDTAAGSGSHRPHHFASDAVGGLAAVGVLHYTASPAVAVATGRLVTEVTDAMWDKIMQCI